VLVAQLTDPHIGADWGGKDPAPRLAAAVRAAAELSPDAVIVSGDLVEHGGAEEYATALELLSSFRAPVHVLPGNHDTRAGLRDAFGLEGAGEEPVQYAVDLGERLRLVVLDSLCPGAAAGSLDGERLAWLDAALGEAPLVPTIVATHHPPLLTGVPAMDEMGLPAADRAALGAVLARHDQVRRVVAGHMHRTITGALGGRTVLTAPSTYIDLRLDFGADELRHSPEPPGFAVHVLADGELTSHVCDVV
jgi:3',5'-cyclic AMP phosphodiesterase CpdA